eukprot:TRINITY_DN90839_c0_g1_i1.p1 TRINITY_DN90839_c0_g1~~TRINITY_DN90839_c0_g1_i1.p1  ORF type:complete len:631 (+),score=167.94 TRINITY_DN90839_c0_g1_i1:103-1995(+)
MVADSKKMKLSAMLDVDLEGVDNTVAEDAVISEDNQGGAPATFSQWFQVASQKDALDCLKQLVLDAGGGGDIAAQVGALIEEERAHQAWVENEEQSWKARKEAEAREKQAADREKQVASNGMSDDLADQVMGTEVNFEGQARCIPLRLTHGERSLLGILEGALYVSEYTDRVDVYHTGSKARRMALQIQQVCAILAGLVVANNLDVAKRPLTERSFTDNQHFFRAVFEIGRRYKILNPDKFRGIYGKLIHMLQDSVKDEVARCVGFECVDGVRTVASFLRVKRRGAELLRDPLLLVATQEVYEDGKTREEVQAEVRRKNEALSALKTKYAEAAPAAGPAARQAGAGGHLAALLKGKDLYGEAFCDEDVETVVASFADHFAFQRYNREPVDRILEYLKTYFSPSSEGKWSLEISRGRGGSCLSHNHRTQYTFVFQTLLLWREIMGNMFSLWLGTEDDLLDPQSRYRLCDTGQGLNRVQSAPRVSRMMKAILGKVQSEVGGWVGLSVVHLGDRDVPNALVFIDKYVQVPRILGPLVRTLDALPKVASSSPAVSQLIDAEYGGVDTLRMAILQDFFRHGFDGSGDDGGSCVDGRLTSCWNWCSKIEKKRYFPAFLLTGFTGFDGGFEHSGGLG